MTDEALANILSVVTAPIDVEGATDTVNVRTACCPAGSPRASASLNLPDGSVVGVIQVRRRGVTALLSDLPVTITNVPEGFTATVEPAAVGVVVCCVRGHHGQPEQGGHIHSVSAAGLWARGATSCGRASPCHRRCSGCAPSHEVVVVTLTRDTGEATPVAEDEPSHLRLTQSPRLRGRADTGRYPRPNYRP